MAKKAKKRGVKPGIKRRNYRKSKAVNSLKDALALKMTKSLEQWKVSENEFPFKEPIETLTPYEQLDSALTQLENRILNTVARIKSLGI